MTSTSDAGHNSADPGIRTYNRDDCIVFHKTRESFGGLSNMATGFWLYVSGLQIPTSEALYQACRFPHLPEIQKTIIQQTSPMTAKMKSKPHRNESRADWEELKVAIMKWCLKVKLVQHWDRFGGLLLETATKPIVERSRSDRFWGAVLEPDGETLVGSNVLGRLLMDLRDRIRKTPQEFTALEPLPIPNFCILGRPIELIARDERNPVDHSEPQQRFALRNR